MFHISLLKKKVNGINNRRDCKQGNWAESHHDSILSYHLGLCKKIPMVSEIIMDIQKYKRVTSNSSVSLTEHLFKLLAEDTELFSPSGTGNKSLACGVACRSSECTSLSCAFKDKCWQEFQFPGMTPVK